MIRRSDNDHVAGELIKLHQKEGYNALYFARFVRITTLFADGIKFVEEQHAWPRANVIEELSQPGIRLTQVTANQSVITHHHERQTQGFRDGFSE